MRSELTNIFHPIKSYYDEIEGRIIQNLRTGIPGLDSGALHLFNNSGKKIRASLVLLSGGLSGSFPDGIAEIAAAAEIVHAATLIHDDIIDRAILRRGLPTVSRKWGNKAAVLIGDYMYTVGLEIPLRYDNPLLFRIMVEGTRDMVKGELLQMEYSTLDSITEEKYFEIIRLKTAVFMASCVKAGAIFGGIGSGTAEDLYNYGLNLGYAFQIIDDTLDFSSGRDSGKNSANDYLEGKVTLPVLYALKSSSGSRRDELVSLLSEPDISKWGHLKEAVLALGGLDYAKKTALEFSEKAAVNLGSCPAGECRNSLNKLAGFVAGREF